MTLVALVACALAALLSAGLCHCVMRWAPRWDLVDRPSDRKNHGREVPLGGGLAVFAAVAIVLLIAVVTAFVVERFQLGDLLPEIVARHSAGVLAASGLLGVLLGASAIVVAMGVWDDRRGLAYQVRLGIQIALTLLLISQGVQLAVLPGWWWLTVPLTVIWIVGLTNAFNFIDNMDGLAAGVGIIACSFLCVISFWVGDLFVGGGYLVLLGALAGFLWFNWPPARLFLGDAGSNFIGFWIGTLTIVNTFKTDAYGYLTLLAPLCILAVPIYDAVTVTFVRLAQGRSPFHADRQHFSHRLVDLGFAPVHAVLTIYLVTIVTGLGGLVLYSLYLPEATGAALIILQLACTLGLIGVLETVARYRRQPTKTDKRHQGDN